MKQIVQDLKTGEIILLDLPMPAARGKGVDRDVEEGVQRGQAA